MSVLERFRMQDRVAIITGGSRGLGVEMARALAEAGAHVTLASRDGDAVQAVAGELASYCWMTRKSIAPLWSRSR